MFLISIDFAFAPQYDSFRAANPSPIMTNGFALIHAILILYFVSHDFSARYEEADMNWLLNPPMYFASATLAVVINVLWILNGFSGGVFARDALIALVVMGYLYALIGTRFVTTQADLRESCKVPV